MAAVKKEVLLPQEVRMYIREHELDKTINSILNDVLKKRPEDPVGYMAERLAESCTSAPVFEALRPVPHRGDGADEQLRFDVVVFSRGVRARVHTLALGDALFQSGDPADAEHPVEPGARAALEAFLASFFEGAFGEVSVEDVLAFHERCAGLDGAPPLRAGQVADRARAEAALADGLVVAAARSLDVAPLQLLQRALAAEWRRVAVEQGSRGLAALEAPYPLRSRGDLAAWRELWPRLALPVVHGGSPGSLRAASLRVCVALTPFAAPAPAEQDEDHPEACPPLGWFAAAARALQAAGKEAVKVLQAEKAANCVVGDAAFAPPGGLLPAAQLARRAAEAAVGAERLAETCGVLLAAGEEAWLPEEGVYEVEVGKKLTLEQLVDLYSELAEEGWVRTIVQPFRREDAAAGCELLLARQPELLLECDYGPEAPPRAPPKGAAFGCVLHLGSSSASRALRGYTQLAPQWQDAGHGYGRCALVGGASGAGPLSVLDVALACRSRLLCFTSEMADQAVAAISAGADEVLCRLLFDDGPASEAS